VTPNAGDLMFISAIVRTNTTASTTITPSDTGSGGYSSVGVLVNDGSMNCMQCFWKIATALDASGITVTITGNGTGSSTIAYIQIDTYRASGPAGGIDIRTGAAAGGSVTTLSLNPATGSIQSSNFDELAITSLMTFAGSMTGTNTFTGTTPALNLTLVAGTVPFVQWTSAAQSSITAASDTWVNTWTVATVGVMFAATFYALPPPPAAASYLKPTPPSNQAVQRAASF
jgi:hypothetical protein